MPVRKRMFLERARIPAQAGIHKFNNFLDYSFHSPFGPPMARGGLPRVSNLVIQLAGTLGEEPIPRTTMRTTRLLPGSIYLIATAVALLLSAGAAAGPDVTVDWSVWNRLLAEHVVEGEVDYTGLGAADEFSGLIESLERTRPGPGRREQLVFYINAYNVLAAGAILRGRSPAGRWGRTRFFYLDQYPVAGRNISLNTLEKELLLPLEEPRVHFAIVCASRSCPGLRSEAYTVAGLDAQLDDNARAFLADSGKNRFDKQQRVAWLSSIFKWYREDFERAGGSVQSYLADYVTDPEVAALLREQAFDIRYLDYDWSLNGRMDSVD